MAKATSKKTSSGGGGGGSYSSKPPKQSNKSKVWVGIGLFIVLAFIMFAFFV